MPGIDAAFLYLETPNAHTHIAGTMVLDPSTMPPSERDPAAVIEEHISAKLLKLRRFRQRVIETPLGLSHPVLAEDPTLHLDEHTHRIHIDPPGRQYQRDELPRLH